MLRDCAELLQRRSDGELKAEPAAVCGLSSKNATRSRGASDDYILIRQSRLLTFCTGEKASAPNAMPANASRKTCWRVARVE